jgi:hypothetical protein
MSRETVLKIADKPNNCDAECKAGEGLEMAESIFDTWLSGAHVRR